MKKAEEGMGSKLKNRGERRVEFLISVIPEINGVHIMSSYMSQFIFLYDSVSLNGFSVVFPLKES